jgi:hypothetical protein
MKKINILSVLFLTILFNAPLLAQDVNVCMQDLSIFAEFAKVKNFKSAYEPWMNVRRDCPTINVAVYSYGERILKDLSKTEPLKKLRHPKKI